jgi:hypothetical protein
MYAKVCLSQNPQLNKKKNLSTDKREIKTKRCKCENL